MAFPKNILFICTGNIFRSMTAEYALKKSLGSASKIQIQSAELIDAPYPVKPMVSDYLRQLGLDVSEHHYRMSMKLYPTGKIT